MRVFREFESHRFRQIYLAGVNGSMTVSKTVGRGSNPWRDANAGDSVLVRTTVCETVR